MEILNIIILTGFEVLKLLLILAGIFFVGLLLVALIKTVILTFKGSRLIKGSQATKSPNRPPAPEGMKPKAPPSIFNQNIKH